MLCYKCFLYYRVRSDMFHDRGRWAYVGKMVTSKACFMETEYRVEVRKEKK